MKILHVAPAYYPAFVYGGPSRTTHGMCVGLVDRGCDLRVLTTDACGLDRVLSVNTREAVEVDGVRVRYCHRVAVHAVSPQLLTELPSMVRWADLVHLTSVYNFTTVPTLATARALDKPLVWSTRGALQRWDGSRNTRLKNVWDGVCRQILPKRSAFHTTSQEEAEESRKRYPQVPAYIVPNGVEVPTLSSDVTPPADRCALLYIGRLHVKKGIDCLIEACAILREAWSTPFHLTIAGSGDPDYTATLESLIKERKLEQEVTMLGFVDGVAKYKAFRESHIAVFPSHTENFAMVVAEALAHGVPVIASTGTPWQGVEEHDCGLWVDNDPLTIASSIRKIFEMDRAAMGQRGRAWMIDRFSWSRVADDLYAIYEEVTN